MPMLALSSRCGACSSRLSSTATAHKKPTALALHRLVPCTPSRPPSPHRCNSARGKNAPYWLASKHVSSVSGMRLRVGTHPRMHACARMFAVSASSSAGVAPTPTTGQSLVPRRVEKVEKFARLPVRPRSDDVPSVGWCSVVK